MVVAPSLPFPPNQGQRVRTWHLLQGLAEPGSGTTVTLLTWSRPDAPAEHRQAVRAAVTELVDLPLRDAPMSLPRRLGRHARFLVGGRPTYVQAMAVERGLTRKGVAAIGRRVIQASGIPDLVVLEEEALADMPRPRLDRPVVLHRLNIFERVVRDVEPQNWFRRLTRAPELRAWRRFDRRVSMSATALVATTPDSANVLRLLAPHIPVHVITNGVEVGRIRHRPSEGADVAFIGWMGYPANVDAARWFVGQIWPIVRSAVPEANVRIIGREPAPAVLNLASDDVIVTGEVRDVAEASTGVRVGIVPLRGGMGIKNKTLELLAMGLPVVSTPAGVEGLPKPRAGVTETEADAVGFARAVVDLLHDPDRADSLGAAGRRYVTDTFAWPPIAADYAELLHSIERRSAPSRPRQ